MQRPSIASKHAFASLRRFVGETFAKSQISCTQRRVVFPDTILKVFDKKVMYLYFYFLFDIFFIVSSGFFCFHLVSLLRGSHGAVFIECSWDFSMKDEWVLALMLLFISTNSASWSSSLQKKCFVWSVIIQAINALCFCSSALLLMVCTRWRLWWFLLDVGKVDMLL